MNTGCIELVSGVRIGPGSSLVVIAGPCVIEAEDVCFRIAGHMQEVCGRLGLPYVFKASFDKANRTSVKSFRGLGLHDGLAVLGRIRERFKVPVLTDVHESDQAALVAGVVDVLQIPAFLCRQTDLLVAAGQTGKPVNIKKGQFLAPGDMATAVEKVRSTGNTRVLVTERGTTFGYHNLVVDMRSLVQMAALGVPVVFDATHAVQLPGGQGHASDGQREFVFPLARAAAAVGIHGLFLEVHPNPAEACSDGPNSLPLQDVESVLAKVKAIHELVG
ncbi:MAG: 3-deoxy-8-phosphooctulonate synthase [Lentisphaerae bacterium RIFOXYB12_FULL_65_16]|nr:MAG: 3-deoxy-8-phosphooctulonate synthase [Lentisphaerae bacterium RIFOXYA12_64_32]OGV88505.1 MAG: 3-deoxy-8-phosphooctulonate synthase [Lentisphaerae bacterium RIFOXYB12_FULL_65_16]